MNLTNTQIDRVEERLNHSGIKSKELYDDLLDHYCFLVEDILSDGTSFDDAIICAEKILCPDGPLQIENDLNYLLNIKSYIMLHKLVFVIAGVAIFFSLLSGAAWMSNLLTQDVAIQFMGLGIIVTLLTVYPFIMYRWYLRSKQNLNQDFA